MQQELDKYGIQMPAFGKIGGILAEEVKTPKQKLGILSEHKNGLSLLKSMPYSMKNSFLFQLVFVCFLPGAIARHEHHVMRL